MTHRGITLTDEERTAALICYGLTCIAWACREDQRPHDDGGPWFYEWVTTRSLGKGGTFGSAVLWAMRHEDERDAGVATRAADAPEAWLSYVEHVVGYRTGPGNGHT